MKNIIIYLKIKLWKNGNKKIIIFRVLIFLDLTLFINVIIKNIIENVVGNKKSSKSLEKKNDFLIINVEIYDLLKF